MACAFLLAQVQSWLSILTLVRSVLGLLAGILPIFKLDSVGFIDVLTVSFPIGYTRRLTDILSRHVGLPQRHGHL